MVSNLESSRELRKLTIHSHPVDTKSSPEITIREEKASTTAPAEKAQESNGVDEEEPTTKVLSKKEKERLKKEREKVR